MSNERKADKHVKNDEERLRDAAPPHDDEELVPADDAVIGRAFRLSLMVIVALAVVAFGAWIVLRPSALEERVVGKDVGDVADRDAPAATMPDVRFVDVTREAGIDFVHTNGATGEKMLPETMGSGAAFFDADGDGDQDLVLVDAAPWPGARGAQGGPPVRFYRNDGTGRFTDATAEAGFVGSAYGVGVAIGDYDGDGDSDLFLTTLGPNRLYENRNGRFVDVTERAGVAGDSEAWSTSAGFFDYDGDGDLDLLVLNYVRWSREIDLALNFTLNGRDRAYGPPTNYAGSHLVLYRNEGGGRFSDVSEQAGVRVVNPLNGEPMAKALALTFLDVDVDGHLDIFVANDTVQNFLLRNRGDGTFEELGALSGVGFDSAGNATGAMGIDAAYYRNDRHLGVGIGNFANEMSSLYVAQSGGLQFSDEAIGEGVGAPSRSVLSFGLFFFDYDLDGRLDLLQTNGHLEDEIQQVQASQTYRQPAQLFWNAGPQARQCFSEVPGERTGDLSRPIVGRAATFADIDGDGDLDVLLTQVAGPPLLLRNDQTLGHHWLRVRLVGGAGVNTDAIGAWVELETAAGIQRRQVMPTRSYLSQVELPLTFGLGTETEILSLRVIWPDGVEQQVETPEPDREIVVVRPA